nr:restriction endonuclease subunit S [uncultured Haemophilus sp.]
MEWLGEVPSHWEVKKMKFLFKDTSIKNKPDETLLSVTQNRGVIPRDWLEERTVMPSGSLETFKFIEKYDFAISLRSFEGGLEICHHDGIISPAYTVLKYNKKLLNNGYYKYLFKCQKFISEMQTSIVGIREGKNISYEELKYSFLPIPQTIEQQKIAQFLDDKTAKIDQAVDLAEKQIALLKEHKQILIQNAVTRGLNPDVPLKDSGVEWIGQMPEHWEVKKLKFEAHITLGKMLCTEYKRGFHLKPYLKSKNIQWLNVDTSSIDEMYFSSYELALYKLEKGDLILSEGGEVGKTCMWNNELDECYIQNSAHKVRLYKKNNNKYFLYLFFSCGHLGVFDSIVNRVSIAHLTKDKLENMKFIFPTLAEQTVIADYLDKQTAKIDQAIALKTAHIEKLKEYKSVLINDVVTGKVRVSV